MADCKGFCSSFFYDPALRASKKMSHDLSKSVNQKRCRVCEYVVNRDAFNDSHICPCCFYKFRFRNSNGHKGSGNERMRREMKIINAH